MEAEKMTLSVELQRGMIFPEGEVVHPPIKANRSAPWISGGQHARRRRRKAGASEGETNRDASICIGSQPGGSASGSAGGSAPAAERERTKKKEGIATCA